MGAGPTCVDEASGGAFAELFGFVRQRDLHHPWDVPWRRLHSDGVGGDQLRGARQDKGINKVKLYTQTQTAKGRDWGSRGGGRGS